MNLCGKEALAKWRKEGSPRLYSKPDILNAIRIFCIDCYGSSYSKSCIVIAPECRFQFLRGGIYRYTSRDENGNLNFIYTSINILHTIKEECTECLGTANVKSCTSPNCGLYKFRFGGSSKKHWGE